MTDPQTSYVEAERPPYLLAGLVALGALVLYVLTLAPTTQFWDTSEYIAAAQVLGIPHPPGNPLFVLIAHTWGLLPLAAGYAMRINLLAAFTSAIAAGCWFLVSERWMREWVPARLPRRLAAVAGALAAATAFTVWNQSVVNENVYPLQLVAIVGVSVYLFLPIRAAHYPPINEGEPTTWKTLWEVLTRQQYGKPPVWERQASLGAQIGMWFQYFSWQWGRDWYDSTSKLFGLVVHWQRTLAVVFFGVGVLGAVRHWVADRRRAIAMTLLMATFTLFLIFYLNFKYGYSWQPEKQLAREVRERDYFFTASFALWGVWVGMGLATLMEWVSDSLEVRVPDGARRWTLATPVLLLALIPLVGNNLTASRKGETLARDFAFDLLQSVEPYGVLVTAGDNDTFPLWYAQEVEHVRQDVTVVNLSLANTDWYVRQLQRRPLATFDSTQAPAIYRGRAWPKPTGKLLSFSDAYVQDSLQPVYWLGEQKTYANLGGVTVTLDPQQLGRQYLERADVIVLQAVKDQLGRRSIYYSRTVGPYADQFGLTGSLEGQGFARKLHPQPLAEADSIKLLPVFGFVNLRRTEALAFGVYHADAAARHRPRGWVDRPSEGVLATYRPLDQSLSQALRTTKPEVANRALLLADSVFKNTSYGYIPPADR